MQPQTIPRCKGIGIIANMLNNKALFKDLQLKIDYSAKITKNIKLLVIKYTTA